MRRTYLPPFIGFSFRNECLTLFLVFNFLISFDSHFPRRLVDFALLFLRVAKNKEPKSDNRIKFLFLLLAMFQRNKIYMLVSSFYSVLSSDHRKTRLIFLSSAAKLNRKRLSKIVVPMTTAFCSVSSLFQRHATFASQR